MTNLPPYVVADPPVAVEGTVGGTTWSGDATGWRGDRVAVTWRTAPGLNDVGWVDADGVHRME